ncbi:hypothetical protein [Streptomyces sp. NPDC005336]|uniref:hypothetical protein n=1 Tax=Streptomyces sp. NPDC005336 TaxID=3157035 RepID=UPI00339EB080
MATHWVDPKRAGLVALVRRLQAPEPRPGNACRCTRRRGLAATVVADGGVAYAVPCNRCGGTGIVR